MSAVREAEPAREAAMAAAGRGIRAEVTTEPIDPSGVLASVGDPRDGAIALFVGVVRNSNEGRPVSGMEYEGYAEMASEQLAAIAAEAAEAIDPCEVLASVGDPGDGAVALFVGVVRNQNQGRPVSGMEYEGYAEMAREQLEAIAAEAAELGGTDRVAVMHRLGVLKVGEPSVAIGVSTPHRAQAFDAARHVIEEIKKRLPVWKREHYLDRGAEWLDGTVPAAAGEPR